MRQRIRADGFFGLPRKPGGVSGLFFDDFLNVAMLGVFAALEQRIVGTTLASDASGCVRRPELLRWHQSFLRLHDAVPHRFFTFAEVVANLFLIVAEIRCDFATDFAKPFETVRVGLC